MSTNANTQADPPVMKGRGYHKLATLMGTEKECRIFRRFSRLNMLNLMSMQAELVDLEDNYNEICKADELSRNEKRNSFSVNFAALRKYDQLDAFQKKTLLDIQYAKN